MRPLLLALALALAWPDGAMAAWQRPVPGPVARPFTYSPSAPFRAGAHRGADLAARSGTAVRAACAGAVVTAQLGAVGGTIGAGVVTLRCGRWRVTALPLASLAVRVGEHVRAGAPIGRVGTMTGHTGLHVGVRRASDRFAYVDPLPLLGSERRPPVGVLPRQGPRVAAPPRTAPAPRVAAPPRAAPVPRGAGPPRYAPAEGRVRVPAGGLAPWPAWVGLALLAVGAVGGGVRIRVRRTRARAPTAVPSAS